MEVVASIWQKVIVASVSTDFMGETVKQVLFTIRTLYILVAK